MNHHADSQETARLTATGKAPYASDPAQSRGRLYAEPESTTRTVFQRDRDRIIHSGAFRKLQYKTQVFVYHEGDYYRTRLTHSIEVGQIARSIARILRIDEDLAEAVALAHDLGHTPFGHAGEHALNEAMQPYGGFDHNDQALRIVTRLEARYAAFDGLNLTWETLEGLVKHNGPLDHDVLPVTIAAFQKQFDLELAGYAGIEAQVAALSDDIAYNTHDIEDGVRAGFFTIEELRALPLVGDIVSDVTNRNPGIDSGRLLHETVRKLVDHLVRDLVAETQARLQAIAPKSAGELRGAGAPIVGLSAAVSADEKVLRKFLWDRLYHDYRVNRMTSKARRIVQDLFKQFIAEPETLPTAWQNQIRDDSAQGGRVELVKARVVADYIAGMTDRFAIAEHRRFFDFYETSQ
jgi:dGTPase